MKLIMHQFYFPPQVLKDYRESLTYPGFIYFAQKLDPEALGGISVSVLVVEIRM